MTNLPTRQRPFFFDLVVVLLIAALASAARGDDLAAPRKLLLGGKYEEAVEAYQALTEKEPVAAAIGQARAFNAIGKDIDAQAALSEAFDKQGANADLLAEIAALHLQCGRLGACDGAVTQALKINPDHLLARWIQAERWRTTGKLDEADQAYKWFVDYYNDHDVKDAEALCLLGRGAAQYARWHRLSDQFAFLVNELYPDALAAEPDYWPAAYESGMLFLEKYNQPEATKQLGIALELNPAAADAHAALARLALQNFELDAAHRRIERALEINPRHLAALQYQADAHLANFEMNEALVSLEKARALNDDDEETLGRLAAAWAAIDGVDLRQPDSRSGKLVAQVEEFNPHCGQFYCTAGATFDLMRKYPHAAACFELAIKRMPQLIESHGALGMVYMRLGSEPEAHKLLNESFEVDPFNVRVANSLKVLEVLDDYAVLETEHFVLRFDRVKDGLLARYMARYLEDEVYPQHVKQFGYEPKEKSLFEIFNRARNTRGHGWFSARMVGLPYVGTVGACAGKIVALASPGDMPQRYNWARVLKHEFVHVLNLQQTNFNIPHWYTEALAVNSEGYPRPPSWNEMLLERVPANKMFNLETINLGFVRPKSSNDWQMAYCQAQLYAEYMLKTYGDDALAKMLACYADNLGTRAALRRSFDVEQEDFEKGYRKYVDELVKELAAGRGHRAEALKLPDLVRAQKEKPDDPNLAAQLALAYLQRKSYPEARKLAEHALEQKPKHPQATVVLARVRMVIGDDDAALAMLRAAVDLEHPEADSLRMLADLDYQAERYADAQKLYELGAKTWRDDLQWTKALARVLIKTGDRQRLFEVLARLAMYDADDLLMRKKLAHLALEDKNYEQAARWALDTIYVNVEDADAHRVLGEALAGQKKWLAAADEYQTAVGLDDKQPEWQLALAEAYAQAGETAKARTTLIELIKKFPQFPDAAARLEALKDK